MQFNDKQPSTHHGATCVYLCLCATDGRELFIGKAVQKAYLEVTEEGAEGAVGSGVTHLKSTHLPPPVCHTHKYIAI